MCLPRAVGGREWGGHTPRPCSAPLPSLLLQAHMHPLLPPATRASWPLYYSVLEKKIVFILEQTTTEEAASFCSTPGNPSTSHPTPCVSFLNFRSALGWACANLYPNPGKTMDKVPSCTVADLQFQSLYNIARISVPVKTLCLCTGTWILGTSPGGAFVSLRFPE